MQSPPPETYTYPQRVPESTNDVNLKRARVVDNDGKSYIRVTGTVTSSDLDPIKEALGEPTDTSSDNTVIGLLKKIDVKQFGVGQAYPGSTGGEIFNYYGTDSNKNIASGDYSTANGYHNTSAGNYSFTAGTNNTVSATASIMLGRSNVGVAKNTFGLGKDLTAQGADCTYVGQYNNTTTALSNPDFVVGVGTSNSNRKNAIECNNAATKICNNLRLATDSTEVNAIIPPEIPGEPEADEQVLATKAYVDKRTKMTIEEDVTYNPDNLYIVAPGDDIDTDINYGAIVVFRNQQDSKSYSFVYVELNGNSQTIEVGGCTFHCWDGRITSDNGNPRIDVIDVIRFYKP